MAADSNQKDRRLKRQARYQSFVWMRPLATDYIPSLGHLIRLSFLDLKNNWIFFSILGVIFAAGLGFLWFGFGQYLDLDINQQRLESLFGDGGLDRIQIAFEQLQYIGSGLSDLSQNFNFYAAAFLTILSLTLISFGRRIQTEDRRQSQSPRAVLDAIYFGSSQLIPYILVILFLFGQALLGLIANGIVVHLNTNGVLESNVETAVGLAGALWANLLCFYMISGSIFGLMIVSRPGSRPATSWQSSWDLTTNRAPSSFPLSNRGNSGRLNGNGCRDDPDPDISDGNRRVYILYLVGRPLYMGPSLFRSSLPGSFRNGLGKV